MPRRRWRTWPQRFGKALMDTGGVVGLIGVGISAVGATIAAPVVITIGGVTIGGALLYAGYRGIPHRMLSASEIVGTSPTLIELEDINPPIFKLGIVGYTQSGKTTFLRQALHQEPGTTRTSKVYATILALQSSPVTYVALLDGDGEQLPQQFEVAEKADLLLVFLDHNQGDDNIAKSKERLEEHDRFMRQLEFYMSRRKPLTHLHLVLNKRDLWERSKGADELRDWLAAHVSHLKGANICSDITSDVHSNLIASDISKMVRQITERAVEL